MTMRAAGLNGLMAAGLMGCWAGAAAAQPASMAYYEYSGSVAAFRTEASRLQLLAADLYAVDAAGNVTGGVPKSVLALAAAHRIQVLATISNFGAQGFDAGIAHAVLKPGPAQDKAVAGMVAAIGHGVAGINLDFENVSSGDRAAYTAFAQRLAAALHAAGAVEVLSVPAETKDDPSDSWTGAYDFAALGQATDLLQVMTYDENGPWGPPGPVAGLDWVGACLAYTKSVVPAARISLGMPAYGYDWNRTKGTGTQIAYNAVPALLARTHAMPQWDTATSSPWFAYKAANGNSHVVWYENAMSVAAKAELAATQAIDGISVYALGMDNTAFWNADATGFAR